MKRLLSVILAGVVLICGMICISGCQKKDKRVQPYYVLCAEDGMRYLDENGVPINLLRLPYTGKEYHFKVEIWYDGKEIELDNREAYLLSYRYDYTDIWGEDASEFLTGGHGPQKKGYYAIHSGYDGNENYYVTTGSFSLYIE